MIRFYPSIAFALFILSASVSTAQNVGIGISTPLQKLHIGGNSNTLRIDGLSSSGTMFGTPAANERLLFVNANGDLEAFTNGTSGQVLTINGSGVPTWSTSSASGWSLSGNSIAGTEFIGTTNTQPFIIKTSNAERARFLSGGQLLINQTTANLSSQLVEATASGSFTTSFAGYSSSSSGYGLIGYNSTAAGKAVVGLNNASSGTTQGGSGVTGQIAQGAGSSSYGGFGVSGVNTSSSGYGVSGIGQNTAGITYSTSGAGGIFNGTSRGSYSAANTAPGNGSFAFGAQGVVTVTPTGTGYAAGLRGDATATGGAADGVEGITASSSGSGVYGGNSATGGDAILGYSAASSGDGFGVYGVSNSSSSVGVAGYSGSSGLLYFTSSGAAFTASSFGATGVATSSTGTGIFGIGNNLSSGQTSANGSGGAFNGTKLGIYSYCTTNANGNAGGYFQSGASNYAYIAYRNNTNGGTDYAINGTGTKATIVSDLQNQPVIMACPEAPEILFEDYGTGKLADGKAHIDLDPIFAKNVTINDKHPLRVFIQLEGECNGVYVTDKSANGFDVKELNSGTSDVSFSWHVIANRADSKDAQGTVISYNADNRWQPAQGIMSSVNIPAQKNKSNISLRELPKDDIQRSTPR